MISYIIEALAFQLLFLIVYDAFLKRETFFQWNRVYLIGTFILSIVLPWIKIEALKTSVSEEFIVYPSFIWQIEGVEHTSATQAEESWLTNLAPEYVVFGIGVLFAALWFCYKLYQIYLLKQKGTIRYYPNFTKVLVKKSELAFSFFKHIFLGDSIKKENQANIVAHEMVHIKQWHSLDLLFFELLRIFFWFNPLVYVYQKRIAELHEFIADAIVAKSNKKEQYQLLLAEAFQTEHISFVNHFFKSSLIKKRIVMLSKTRSKKIYQFKYLLLIPLVLVMLLYTSCELQDENEENLQSIPLKTTNEEVTVSFAAIDEVPIFPGCENVTDKKTCFQESIEEHIRKNFNYPLEMQEQGIQGRVSTVFTILKDGTISNIRMRGPDKMLEAEALRILERLPQMTPGEHEGKAVNVPFAIPIVFKLLENTVESQAKVKNEVSIIRYGNPSSNVVPFAIIDEVPVFPGCENAIDKKTCFQESMKEHIRKNFRYPIEAQESGIQGRVSVVFKIATDGTITNIRMRGPDKLLENEALRIIERLPKMIPGEHEGKAVDVPFSIPITFKLQ